jgi:hypothetical protein
MAQLIIIVTLYVGLALSMWNGNVASTIGFAVVLLLVQREVHHQEGGR